MKRINDTMFRLVMAGKYDTYDQLAVACQISRSTLSRFRYGSSISTVNVRRILRELGLPFAEVAKSI